MGAPGPLDKLGRANPRLYLPTFLGGHTPPQMREAHHVNLYSAGQHADAMIKEMTPQFAGAFGGRSNSPPAQAAVALATARTALGPVMGHSRHHKIPADRLRTAWDAGTLAQRQATVKSSMVAMIEGGDAVRGAPGVAGATTRNQQVNSMATMNPRQFYEWHPENITPGRQPNTRAALGPFADPGNNPDPAILPSGARTPRSSIAGALPAAPTPAQIQAALEGMRTTPVAPGVQVGATRFTDPTATHSHN